MINKKKTGSIKRQYFDEAREWDSDSMVMTKRSERRAWMVAGTAVLIAVLEAVGIFLMLPLKTVEPFVIRVDNSTGVTEVVSVLKEQDIDAREALNKFWLSQYMRYRERYLWDTRNSDRYMVGLMSSPSVQQQYAEYTDPRKNPNAPVAVYGENSEVKIKIKSISMINEGEKMEDETRYTTMVRYTKRVERSGERSPLSHWAATIVFTYRSSPMKVDDRLKNPLGFQVLSYRNDQESEG